MVIDVANAEISPLFDNLFVPYEHGLKPPDFLPHLDDQTEVKLLADAKHAFEALKKFDKDYMDALKSPDEEKRRIALEVDQEHRIQVNQLNQHILDERFKTENDPHLEVIKAKYKKADAFITKLENERGPLPQFQRHIIRLEQFPEGIQFATDMDLTMTTTDGYLPMIPGSVQSENYMAHKDHGRQKFPEVFVRYWKEAMGILKGNFKLIGQNIPFRPGVEEFFKQAHDAKIPTNIVSANFLPLVSAVASRVGVDADHTYAVKPDDISVTDKSTVLAKLALANPNRAMIYFGDGGSDEVATEPPANGVIALYGALKGGSFERVLKAKNLPHFTYETFSDILNVAQDLHLFAPRPATGAESSQ